MTPYAFAQKECSNHTGRGFCLLYGGRLTCALARGGGCNYFAQHVLPLVDKGFVHYRPRVLENMRDKYYHVTREDAAEGGGERADGVARGDGQSGKGEGR